MGPFKYSLPAILVVAALAQLLFLAGVPQTPGQSKYIPVNKYDPKRDAAQDIQDAVKEAQRAHKRILLEVGGEWCSWCHTLDRFFETHAELIQLRDKNFVTVKINFSGERIPTETSCLDTRQFRATLIFLYLILTANFSGQRTQAFLNVRSLMIWRDSPFS